MRHDPQTDSHVPTPSSDLFGPLVSPIPSVAKQVPSYGSLTQVEELNLYVSDRLAWIDYVAPNMGRRLVNGGPDAFRLQWPCLSRDYQVAVWKTLSEPERALARSALAQQQLR